MPRREKSLVQKRGRLLEVKVKRGRRGAGLRLRLRYQRRRLMAARLKRKGRRREGAA